MSMSVFLACFITFHFVGCGNSHSSDIVNSHKDTNPESLESTSHKEVTTKPKRKKPIGKNSINHRRNPAGEEERSAGSTSSESELPPNISTQVRAGLSALSPQRAPRLPSGSDAPQKGPKSPSGLVVGTPSDRLPTGTELSPGPVVDTTQRLGTGLPVVDSSSLPSAPSGRAADTPPGLLSSVPETRARPVVDVLPGLPSSVPDSRSRPVVDAAPGFASFVPETGARTFAGALSSVPSSLPPETRTLPVVVDTTLGLPGPASLVRPSENTTLLRTRYTAPTVGAPTSAPPRPPPPPVASPVVRSPNLHFVMDPDTFRDRGIVGIPNAVNLCFISSPLQLLLHVPQLRTLIFNLANHEPAIAGFSPVLGDLVYLFNKVWGDGWPNPAPAGTYPLVHIQPRLYASIVGQQPQFGVDQGRPGNSDVFTSRFLAYIRDELDRLVPGRGIRNFFTPTLLAPGRPVESLIISLMPDRARPGYARLESLVLNWFHDQNRFRFTEPFSTIITFEFVGERNRSVDPPLVLTLINGLPIDRDDPRASADNAVGLREQYNLIGYTVHTGNHYKAVVKHPDTGSWFQIDDARVVPIPGHDPRHPIIMAHPAFVITNIMYSKQAIP